MTDTENRRPLSWDEIESAIAKAIAEPYDVRYCDIKPEQAVLFRVMLALCELHTGQRPHRVVGSADSTLMAYYFGVPKMYGMIEVYQDVDTDNIAEAVLAWNDLRSEWSPDVRAEDLTLAQATDSSRFKAMIEAIGISATAPLVDAGA